MLRIRRRRVNREKRERMQREEEEKRREEGEKTETENEQNGLSVIMFSVMLNTWNCLYIDNMCSTSRLGLKPSKPTISL